MRLAEQLRTTTFALTLRYMVLFFVSVTILMGVINWAITGFIEKRADRMVTESAETFALLYRLGGVDTLRPFIQARQIAERSAESFYLLVDPQYQPLAGNLADWPNLQPSGDGWVAFNLRRSGEVLEGRGRVVSLPGGAWLLVGREIQAFGALTEILDRVFVIVLGVTLLLAFAGGLLMSNNVLKRVNAINTTSRQIMAGDLSRRMPTRGTRDEFDQLSLNLNAMLDQIESLLDSIRHMSDNVAHDLRTPLTRLRGRLESLRLDARESDIDEIDACLQDADGLLDTFRALLSITRIESGASDAQLIEVDLAEITRDACELYQAVAEDQSLTLACTSPASAMVRGDRNLIFQALTNLLDNAIKYGKPGGNIGVAVNDDGDTVTLAVSDDGPGIPPDRREQVLQRFYRLDDSRSAPGSGLGLSLVQAIANRHKAKLLLDDNEPGLRARLIFAPAV
ncbi:MAG: HAMP domain-containing sensor histidine kinase [Gammaproteobacteria bacterium]|nr:HAMP domain-containing sensor histidine kinase [Gammaproteobacteria bacterium]